MDSTLMLFFTSIIMASSVSFSALPSHHHIKKGFPLTSSTISASPSYFSPSPSSSFPAMSPDVTPLLPSPVPDSAFSPSDSSIPTIPSSPSPPNPETIFPPQPLMAAASPTGSMPDSSSVDLELIGSFFLGLLALWLVQI